MSFGAKFAPSADHCRQAVDLTTSWLPSGFIPTDFLPPFAQAMISGETRARIDQSMLPAPENWPDLGPACYSGLGDPRERFVHTTIRKVYEIRRIEGMLATRAALPYFKITVVPGDATTDLHRHRDGRLYSVSAPNLLLMLEERVWGCCCATMAMSPKMAVARGFDIPSEPLPPLL